LGEAVSQVLARHLPTPQEYVGVNDTFGESGTPDQLMTKYGLDTIDVINAAKRAIQRK
jgi:transketolase